MVEIIEARPARGYSAWDHLFSGNEADAVVGRSYRSVREACAAADRAVAREADQRAVWGGPHVHVRLRTADGSEVERTT